MKNQIKVLINNVGSQAVDIIKLLHKEDIYVMYSAAAEDKLIKKEADEFIIEDVSLYYDINKYVKYLIELCKNNKINLFIPFKEMFNLNNHKNEFIKNNINILLPNDIDLFNILNNKALTYDKLIDFKEIIPEYYLVKDIQSFKEACNKLRNKNKEVCMKYVTDIASNSFRIINFKEHTLKELSKKTNAEKSRLSHLLDYEQIIKMLEKEALPCNLIVMEYMSGKEISCDCLKTNSGNIIIPRIKLNDKTQLITKDKKIIDYCEKILNYTNYNTPCNIQFKMDENKNPKLLEINTRMSGGIMISSFATNINIPAISVKQSCGEKIYFNNEWDDVIINSNIQYRKDNTDTLESFINDTCQDKDIYYLLIRMCKEVPFWALFACKKENDKVLHGGHYPLNITSMEDLLTTLDMLSNKSIKVIVDTNNFFMGND